jgi:hypothetical protein
MLILVKIPPKRLAYVSRVFLYLLNGNLQQFRSFNYQTQRFKNFRTLSSPVIQKVRSLSSPRIPCHRSSSAVNVI